MRRCPASVSRVSRRATASSASATRWLMEARMVSSGDDPSAGEMLSAAAAVEDFFDVKRRSRGNDVLRGVALAGPTLYRMPVPGSQTLASPAPPPPVQQSLRRIAAMPLAERVRQPLYCASVRF